VAAGLRGQAPVAPPASILPVVQALARVQLEIEIEVLAAPY
jgi:hypothetical protein